MKILNGSREAKESTSFDNGEMHGGGVQSEIISFASRLRALPTRTKVESETSQSKSGTFVKLKKSGEGRIGKAPVVIQSWSFPEKKTAW